MNKALKFAATRDARVGGGSGPSRICCMAGRPAPSWPGGWSMSDGVDWLPPEVNTGVAHSARVYDYWLGGKDNFAADRALGDAMIAAMPSTRFAARANRAFLGRAVRYLADK